MGVSLVMAYFIYDSITVPIRFERTKQDRFARVIEKLKDIRNAQDAHFAVKGDYAKTYNDLENFIENGQFTITTQRDTSWVEYDKNYRIDVMKQGVHREHLRFTMPAPWHTPQQDQQPQSCSSPMPRQ